MNINVASTLPESLDALIILYAEGATLPTLDESLTATLNSALQSGDVTGKSGEIITLYPATGPTRLILTGVGADHTADALRQAAARALKQAQSVEAASAALVLTTLTPADAEAIAEGAVLGLYRYHGQKTDEQPAALPQTLTLVVADTAQIDALQHAANNGSAIATATNLARDLVNLPANICTPAYLGQTAQSIGQQSGLKVDVLGRKQIEALNMGALLSVAQGTDTPPQFIIMEHNAERAGELETIVLVGKGVTFDTGGYSLKTRDGMVGMKADMGGGAAVIGAMQAIAALDVPLHVVGLIPAVDNMVNGSAYRPQDVLTASNGVTIEIISTDAEGRLLLADALVFASRYKPAAVVDIATLTGACVVALGTSAAGLFSNNDSIRDALQAAAERTSEKVWPLPLFPEYDKAIESNTADIKNTGGSMGGVGTSAAFLQRFVDYPVWGHLDIAGVAGIESLSGSSDIAYMPGKGATGYGVRLLTDFVRNWQN